MAHDEDLAARMREALDGLPGVSEKRMMGGMFFMLAGNMVGGTHRDAKTGDGFFVFRIGKDNEADAAARPEGAPMIMGGRRMGGFFHVGEDECTDAVLRDWVSLALSFVCSLPPKG